mgnify:FL=1
MVAAWTEQCHCYVPMLELIMNSVRERHARKFVDERDLSILGIFQDIHFLYT